MELMARLSAQRDRSIRFLFSIAAGLAALGWLWLALRLIAPLAELFAMFDLTMLAGILGAIFLGGALIGWGAFRPRSRIAYRARSVARPSSQPAEQPAQSPPPPRREDASEDPTQLSLPSRKNGVHKKSDDKEYF
jgi:hypothetical protein